MRMYQIIGTFPQHIISKWVGIKKYIDRDLMQNDINLLVVFIRVFIASPTTIGEVWQSDGSYIGWYFSMVMSILPVSRPPCRQPLGGRGHCSHQSQLSSNRAVSRFAPSQWETALICNISHWLGASLESVNRAVSRCAPSQWEMALLSNNISHWLGASLESALSKWDVWLTIHRDHSIYFFFSKSSIDTVHLKKYANDSAFVV